MCVDICLCTTLAEGIDLVNMSGDLMSLLKSKFRNLNKDAIAEVAKYVTDTYVPNAEYEQMKAKVEKRDKHIKNLKEDVKEQSECAQSYWAMIEEKDRKINSMKAYIDKFEYEDGEDSSVSSSESSDSADNLETEVKELQNSVDITEKGIREAEDELIKAKKAVASYKDKLGLSPEAKLDEVSLRIDEMISENYQNYEELKYVKIQLEEKSNNVIHLIDKVQELTTDKNCLTFQLEIKKRTLERTKSVLNSQRITRDCDRYTASTRGARPKPPPELEIRSVPLTQKCNLCKQDLTIIKYCEECYQRLVKSIRSK